MQKKVVNTEKAPNAIGPYTQAIVQNQLVFVSGQLGIDPATSKMKSGIREQATQALRNLEAILEEAGSSFENVLKTTIFLKDMDDFVVVNEIYSHFFTEPFPARSAVQISQLPKQGLVEIQAIASSKQYFKG